jgi:hypothetical protein
VLISLAYVVVRRALQLVTLRFRSHDFKELEIVVLRHELAILRRQTRRPVLATSDRIHLAAASRLLPRASWPFFIVTLPRSSVGTADSWPGDGRTRVAGGDPLCEVTFAIW